MGVFTSLLTRELAAAARWARRQTKSLNEHFFLGLKKKSLKDHKSGQCQRSKSSIFALSATDMGIITDANPKFVKKASQGMEKVSYKYGIYTK